MKLLKDEAPALVRISSVSELQIVIDITHEPWRTFARKLVIVFEQELNECLLTMGDFQSLIDVIDSQQKEIQ